MRSRRDFLRMKQGSRRFYGRFLIIDLKKSSFDSLRLGITVTKKFGKAHERNRFKRLVREVFRLNKEKLPIKSDILIRPRKEAKNASMRQILEDFERIFKVSN